METRVALAVCVVLGSALCGKALSDAARRRARTVTDLAEGLKALRLHMTGMLEPLGNALQHSDCPLLAKVGEGMKGGGSAADVWRTARPSALGRGGAADALTDRDAEALDRLFGHLGLGGREEQKALLDGIIADVERLREDAAARAREAERLYTALGFLIGLMLALIVL